jgi:hypothetical protein
MNLDGLIIACFCVIDEMMPTITVILPKRQPITAPSWDTRAISSIPSAANSPTAVTLSGCGHATCGIRAIACCERC